MKKAVYCVLTVALYEHASLKLATADYDEARESFEALGESNPWETIILEEWYDGKKTTLDTASRY